MEELAKWFASLGVGGVLAYVFFLGYRQDRAATEKRMDEMQKRVEVLVATTHENSEKMLANYRDLSDEVLEVVRENSRVVGVFTNLVMQEWGVDQDKVVQQPTSPSRQRRAV